MMKSDNGNLPMNGSWQAKGGEDRGVISYLARLGLAETDLEKVTHLLHEINMIEAMEIPDPGAPARIQKGGVSAGLAWRGNVDVSDPRGA